MRYVRLWCLFTGINWMIIAIVRFMRGIGSHSDTTSVFYASLVALIVWLILVAIDLTTTTVTSNKAPEQN